MLMRGRCCALGAIGGCPCDGGCWNWSEICCRPCLRCLDLQCIVLVGGCAHVFGSAVAPDDLAAAVAVERR